jgi:hypothetical protein
VELCTVTPPTLVRIPPSQGLRSRETGLGVAGIILRTSVGGVERWKNKSLTLKR